MSTSSQQSITTERPPAATMDVIAAAKAHALLLHKPYNDGNFNLRYYTEAELLAWARQADGDKGGISGRKDKYIKLVVKDGNNDIPGAFEYTNKYNLIMVLMLRKSNLYTMSFEMAVLIVTALRIILGTNGLINAADQVRNQMKRLGFHVASKRSFQVLIEISMSGIDTFQPAAQLLVPRLRDFLARQTVIIDPHGSRNGDGNGNGSGIIRTSAPVAPSNANQAAPPVRVMNTRATASAAAAPAAPEVAAAAATATADQTVLPVDMNTRTTESAASTPEVAAAAATADQTVPPVGMNTLTTESAASVPAVPVVATPAAANPPSLANPTAAAALAEEDEDEVFMSADSELENTSHDENYNDNGRRDEEGMEGIVVHGESSSDADGRNDGNLPPAKKQRLDPAEAKLKARIAKHLMADITSGTMSQKDLKDILSTNDMIHDICGYGESKYYIMDIIEACLKAGEADDDSIITIDFDEENGFERRTLLFMLFYAKKVVDHMRYGSGDDDDDDDDDPLHPDTVIMDMEESPSTAKSLIMMALDIGSYYDKYQSRLAKQAKQYEWLVIFDNIAHAWRGHP